MFNTTVKVSKKPRRLVTSANTPAGFELFLADTATQVLFNPARAFSLQQRFLYGNYYVGRSPRPIVSVAYLANDWLFEVENRVSSNFQSRVLQDSFVKQAGYALGAEIGLAGEDWDFVTSVSFQRPGEERNIRSEARQVRSDTSFSADRPPATSLTVTDVALISRIDQSPALLGWKATTRKEQAGLPGMPTCFCPSTPIM